MKPITWNWTDREWCAKCEAHVAWRSGDRCACCNCIWGDPYAKGKCKNQHKEKV